MLNLLKGSLCQSCGMPLNEDENKGTNIDGSKSSEYCKYCFQNGEFTAPEITCGEMIKKVSKIAVEKLNMPAFQAAMIANSVIPKLKRWKN